MSELLDSGTFRVVLEVMTLSYLTVVIAFDEMKRNVTIRNSGNMLFIGDVSDVSKPACFSSSPAAAQT